MGEYKMLNSSREKLLVEAKEAGWRVEVDANGSDHYKKLICLQSKGVKVFVDKNIGISKSGDINYLKIYVHPDRYVQHDEFADLSLQPCINRQTKRNRHSHSALKGFPCFEGKGEPCGKAYKLNDVNDWKSFLIGFAGFH
ncbi:hypothetical protein [Amphritea balenae]|uniref:Uncharacterized protein n=1 Tax=Amphritea balenae TaxID=452629 RepID=A0A3P1SMW7_9GAMM|nr:hypothetical protein [Amphritea balenae]RRC98498.1 hypothetical protein EHS89_12820 [Amphritea balenae]GGK65000.1 hypothetical protein GCM10007941_13900 [Amphritea balenae]